MKETEIFTKFPLRDQEREFDQGVKKGHLVSSRTKKTFPKLSLTKSDTSGLLETTLMIGHQYSTLVGV